MMIIIICTDNRYANRVPAYGWESYIDWNLNPQRKISIEGFRFNPGVKLEIYQEIFRNGLKIQIITIILMIICVVIIVVINRRQWNRKTML